jgi:hypothetical protein
MGIPGLSLMDEQKDIYRQGIAGETINQYFADEALPPPARTIAFI